MLPFWNHNISPKEAFGSLSTLATDVVAEQSGFSYGFALQMVVLAVGFVYIFYIVRYWEFLYYFLLKAVGFYRNSSEKAHINPAEQTNIEVVMILMGTVILSLCTLRLGSMWGIIPQGFSPWVVCGVSLAALLLELLLKMGSIYLVSAVCENYGVGRALIGIKSLYLAVCFVVVIPFGILFLLSPEIPSKVGFFGMALAVAIALIIFVKETFLFFVSQKISILHWFLYLCALEIFPLSLILAPIVR